MEGDLHDTCVYRVLFCLQMNHVFQAFAVFCLGARHYKKKLESAARYCIVNCPYMIGKLLTGTFNIKNKKGHQSNLSVQKRPLSCY